jgi:hypothetical protein
MINLKAAVVKWNGIVNFNGYEIWICICMYVVHNQNPWTFKKNEKKDKKKMKKIYI